MKLNILFIFHYKIHNSIVAFWISSRIVFNFLFYMMSNRGFYRINWKIAKRRDFYDFHLNMIINRFEKKIYFIGIIIVYNFFQLMACKMFKYFCLANRKCTNILKSLWNRSNSEKVVHRRKTKKLNKNHTS